MSLKENRFLHPYYLLNMLLFVTYIGLRVQRLNPRELSSADMFGISRETQIYFCLFLMLFTRLLSAPTADVYLASAFMFARVAILLCLWYMSPRLFATFAALWSILFALVPQPRQKMPNSVSTLNNVTFRQRIVRNTYKSFYIVWLHAPWSARCSQLVPVLVSLARRFQHPRIIFTRLDVSKFPDVAKDLGVSISPASKQLPCIVCFKMGKEIARIPVVDANGRVPLDCSKGFTDKQVVQRFDLNSCLQTAKQWEKEAQDRFREKKGN